jgi:hypothetical protein
MKLQLPTLRNTGSLYQRGLAPECSERADSSSNARANPASFT